MKTGEQGKTYLANALANAFLQLAFCAPTKLSTVTAIARSTSCEVQYSDRRILQKASLMRMMASRWRTCGFGDQSARILILDGCSACLERGGGGLTVIGYAPVAKLSLRISAKSLATLSWSIWYSFGRHLSLAYNTYFRNNSCGISPSCFGSPPLTRCSRISSVCAVSMAF